jgi:AraC-like DNA-binding protein
LAGLPQELIESPHAGRRADDDVLSDVLHTVRLSGSLQFCFMPTGAWQTDATPSLAKLADSPSRTMPFHIMVEGTCWLKMDGREWVLAAGDIVAFPFGTGHQLGAGSGGRLVTPVQDLPPKPWREIPVLRYGDGPQRVRLLCGYLLCDAMSFRPLRNALPPLIHVRTASIGDAGWLRATIGQIVAEVDSPRTGGVSMLERLTEITFIELLRHEIIAARPGAVGWLAALADPALGRCLALIHDDPRRDWSILDLAAASGLSRSTLTERFETVLDTSPMRYVRDWRLYLASVALSTTGKGIAAVAHDAGYGTEAAFNRAFSRAYGVPPAAWRQTARHSLATVEKGN